jgi:hypothetical protein
MDFWCACQPRCDPIEFQGRLLLASKEVIGKARDGALDDLGCSELSFSSLDFDESIGFIWVTFPRHLGVLLQGQTRFQDSLGCFR